MTKLKMILVTSAVSLAAMVGIASAKAKHGHGGRAAMMQKFDANGDGKLDDAERAKAKENFKLLRQQKQAAKLAQFDANRNGALDPAEKDAMRTQRAEKRFAMLDANKDGRVTLDEFKSAKQGKGRGKGRGHEQP